MVVYHQSGRKRVPGHWGIFVGLSDLSNGTVFHATGSGFQGYKPEIKRDYDLRNTNRKYSSFALGRIDDSYLGQLEQLAATVPGAGTAPNPLDPFSVSSITHSYNNFRHSDWNSRARTARTGRKNSFSSSLARAFFLLRQSMYWPMLLLSKEDKLLIHIQRKYVGIRYNGGNRNLKYHQ